LSAFSYEKNYDKMERGGIFVKLDIQKLFESIDEKIVYSKKTNKGEQYVLTEEIERKIQGMNDKEFIFDLIKWEKILSTNKEEVLKKIKSKVKAEYECFTYEERLKVYQLFSKKLKLNPEDRELFLLLFNKKKIQPYWNRLESLFENTPAIDKENYDMIVEIFNKMIDRMLKIGFSLVENEENEWLENFKMIIEMHELCEHTKYNLKEMMREYRVFSHNEKLNQRIKDLYANWYKNTAQTFGVYAEKGQEYNDYHNGLDNYWYLFDEEKKQIARETLLHKALEFINEKNDEDRPEYWIYLKERLEKYLT
jgi:hypothetical protein